GTLEAQVDVTFRGDSELIFRALFRALPNAAWDNFVQNLSTQLGFQGNISELKVDPVDDLTRPFHWSYRYECKNYSDWANYRVTPPLPSFTFTSSEADEKPSEPTPIGSPGEILYRSSITLPSGYSVEIPENRAVAASFAEYRATYKAVNGVLFSERRLTEKQSRVPVAQWQDYLKFEKSVSDDQSQYIQLVKTAGQTTTVIADNNPQAADLLQKAYQSFRARDVNAARDQIAQAERINPKQVGLWSLYGYIYMVEGKLDEAFDAMEKEVRLHPDELRAYLQLVQMQGHANREEDAIATLKIAAGKWPDNVSIISHLCTGLMEKKRYEEMVDPLQKALAANPGNSQLISLLAAALLYSGNKQEGLAATTKLAGDSTDPVRLNDAAYYLADTQTELPQAVKYAEKAVTLVEAQMKTTTLSQLANEDFTRVNQLASFWDTLGWAYFQTGNYDKADKYLEAAWMLSQNATVADHLGSIYLKEGKKAQAAHIWRLAVAANGKQTEASDHLRKLGIDPTKPVAVGKGKVSLKNPISVPVEELSRMRTIGVPSLQEEEGSATFLILFSADKVEDVQFVNGSETLKTAASELLKADYHFHFPDAGPERIVRRGILSCSQYTEPNCQLTLLLPSSTRK
ncbi:MAG TPA: tetratricopeptide repeat protein, partial [Bryobacteraceae bacterium]